MAAGSVVGMYTLTLTIILGYIQGTGALQCHACSYIFSGNDGSYDYGCVNDTAKFNKVANISCQSPNKCIIKTVYTQNYGYIHSMVKGCQIPEKESGCVTDGEQRPTCFYNCESDFCNGVDGDLKPVDGPGHASTIQSTSLCLISGLFLTVFLKFVLA